MRHLTIIPARYDSSRFPGKPLALIAGKPLVWWTWQVAMEAGGDVYVATDDHRIRLACEGFGARVLMTSPRCRNGTERCAEAAEQLQVAPDQIIINLQGDALLTPARFVQSLRMGYAEFAAECDCMTLVRRRARKDDPSAVCVVMNGQGECLYFSRERIPHGRKAPLYHLGLYAYTAAGLARYRKMPSRTLERDEQLEQLRWLENGAKVRAFVVYPEWPVVEVNFAADVPTVETVLRDLGSAPRLS